MLEEYVKFYYMVLNDKEKEIYMTFYNAFKKREKSIKINANPKVFTIDDIIKIMKYVYNDTPAFYYLDLYCCEYYILPDGYIYKQEYLYTEEQIAKFDAMLESVLITFKNNYIKKGMSDYDKELVIHDYLVRTIKYDKKEADEDRVIADEAYNVLGALIKREAVCWGIACAFKLLCDYCKVKCFVAIGKSVPSNGDSGHAWNIVRIEDKEYHVDVTWDLKDKKDISFCYDYFNLDDFLIKFDHTWDSKLYPKCCSIEHNYYYRHKLFVKELSDIKDFVKEKLKQKETYIAFKFAGDMPSSEKIDREITKGFLMALAFKSYACLISEKTHNIYIEIR